MKRLFRFPAVMFAAVAVPVVALAQAAAAAVQTLPDPSNLTAFAQVIFAAVTGGHWALAASGGVVGLVFLCRKYLAPKVPFLGTARGIALLALVAAVAGGVANALLANAPVTVALILQSLGIAAGAGGLSLLKTLVFGDDAAAQQRIQDAGTKAAAAVPTPPVKSPMDIANGA